MKKRILSLAISAALVLTMLPAGALAAGDKGTPPVYNKATGCYEISTPDQLLYLSGSWKDGAPRDGQDVYKRQHSQAAAPGYAEYYLWCIRLQDDKNIVTTVVPEYEWVTKADAKYFPDI